MHLIESNIAQHRLQQCQAKGGRDWAWPHNPLWDLAWAEGRKATKIIESPRHRMAPSHPRPTLRLTVNPPEHIERWTAIGVRGQDIPQQAHLHRGWVRGQPGRWGLEGSRSRKKQVKFMEGEAKKQTGAG